MTALVHPFLKGVGFRKRAHAFNRTPEPGLVQVVNFQMGAFNRPAPGQRRTWPRAKRSEAVVAHRAADQALVERGLPWLDRLSSRKGILHAYEEEGRYAIGLGPAGLLRIAWLLRATNPEAADAVRRSYLNEQHTNPRHREWLERTLTAAGLGHLLKAD